MMSLEEWFMHTVVFWASAQRLASSLEIEINFNRSAYSIAIAGYRADAFLAIILEKTSADEPSTTS
jgi:hypothetical protein